jgi:hypothetical protein
MTQVANDPADALQVGLYELLSGDATLDALILGVYDGVPEDTTLGEGQGYVVVGEMTSLPDGTHDATGRATDAVVHTWTRASSHRIGNAIGARVAALLTHQPAALGALVDGHAVWRVAHEFAQTLEDPEPGIRHRIDRFRIWTSQED